MYDDTLVDCLVLSFKFLPKKLLPYQLDCRFPSHLRVISFTFILQYLSLFSYKIPGLPSTSFTYYLWTTHLVTLVPRYSTLYSDFSIPPSLGHSGSIKPKTRNKVLIDLQ